MFVLPVCTCTTSKNPICELIARSISAPALGSSACATGRSALLFCLARTEQRGLAEHEVAQDLRVREREALIAREIELWIEQRATDVRDDAHVLRELIRLPHRVRRPDVERARLLRIVVERHRSAVDLERALHEPEIEAIGAALHVDRAVEALVRRILSQRDLPAELDVRLLRSQPHIVADLHLQARHLQIPDRLLHIATLLAEEGAANLHEIRVDQRADIGIDGRIETQRRLLRELGEIEGRALDVRRSP